MKSMRILKILLLAFLIGACVEVSELKEESQTVKLGGAEYVDLKIKMGAGELKIHGGAEELMEGYFSYNVARWKPEIDYYVSGNRGILSVRQGKSSGVPVGNARNRWDISLRNDIPISLEVDFGAGEGRLDLSGLRLESLGIDMGVGELKIDLSGDRNKSLDVEIDGGVGSGTIYLPEHIGVRVRVDGGIGSVNAKDMNKAGNVYTNESFGKTDVSIKIDIDAGIGSIDLKLK